MELFLELVMNNGLLGLGVGLIVLVGVFLLARGGIAITGDQKRAANVVLSILLAFTAVDFSDGAGIVAAIASVASALVYQLIRSLAK